jgi:NAD(P)H-quinone oxidoreductase subunit 2
MEPPIHDTLLLYTNALKYTAPEIVLVVGIMLAALWNLFAPKSRAAVPILTIIAMVVSSFLLAQQFNIPERVLLFPPGLFTVDKLTVAFGLIANVIGIICVCMTMSYDYRFANNRGEYYAILLAAVLAVCFLAGTTDLIMLFVGLETLTICCVLMSGFAKRDRKSNEASLKYLLSTAATTATFLYGLSFLYGMTASTNYYEIAPKMAIFAQSPSLVLIFLMVLLISVIGFKLSMVPFHMWTPDVYEGAPTPVAAFLSVGSKLGGFVVAIRLLTVVFASAAQDWGPVLGALAILSMIMGNLIALAQTSLKRMLAYSSIAHVGYILIGIVANTPESLSALVFYVMVYGFMNLGAFCGAILFENEAGTDNIEEMAGLVRKRPWLAAGLGVCLLNLAGLPVPPAGFLAKVFIFWSGFQMFNALGYWMIGAALLTSIPAVFYYTRVAIMMFVKEPSPTVAALPVAGARRATMYGQGGTRFALALSIAGIIASTVLVSPMMQFSSLSIGNITRAASISLMPGSETR